MIFEVVTRETLRTTYELKSDEIQKFFLFVYMPWDLRIVWGITCDTVKIPGFNSCPKRGYILINSAIMTALLLLRIFTEFESANSLQYCLFFINLTMCFCDAVADGMICIEQRSDPENGAQDLQSVNFLFFCVGSIFGSLSGGYLEDQGKGRQAFYLIAFASLGSFITAWNMTIE